MNFLKKIVNLFSHPTNVRKSNTYKPIQKTLISCGNDNTVRVWKIGLDFNESCKKAKIEKKCIKIFRHERAVRFLELIRRNKEHKNQLVTVSSDYYVKIWNLFKKEKKSFSFIGKNKDELKVAEKNFLVAKWKAHDEGINCCRELEYNYLATASFDYTIKLWDLNNLKLKKTITGHEGAVYFILEITKNIFATCSADKTIKIWDLETFELIRTLKGHNDWVTILKLIKNGRDLISGSYDGSVMVWNWQNGELLKKVYVLENHLGRVFKIWRGFEVFNNYEFFVGSWNQNTILNKNLFDAKKHEVLDRGIVSKYGENNIYFITKLNENYMIVGNKCGDLNVWNLQTRKVVKSLCGHKGYIHHVITVEGLRNSEVDFFFTNLQESRNNSKYVNCIIKTEFY